MMLKSYSHAEFLLDETVTHSTIYCIYAYYDLTDTFLSTPDTIRLFIEDILNNLKL